MRTLIAAGVARLIHRAGVGQGGGLGVRPRTIVSGVATAFAAGWLLFGAVLGHAEQVAARGAEEVSDAKPYSIPAQPISTALKAFAEQSALQLIFTESDVASDTTAGVKGSLAPTAALDQILKGTKLEYEITPNNVVVVRKAGGASRTGGVSEVEPIAPRNSQLAQNAQDSGNTEAKSTSGEASVSEETEDNKVTEIVVTAQKREEKFQDVPTSIVVLSGAHLESRGFNQISDYVKAVPSLRMVGAGGPGEGQTVIRSVSAGDDIQSVVGIYLDDTSLTPSSPRGWNGLTIDPAFVDIDHIEVLRGPQSTLYGASALGGLIKYVTKKPNLERFEGALRIEGSKVDGGGSGYGASASFSGPIAADRVAVRASGFYRENPGFIDDDFRSEDDANTSVVKGGRFSLLAVLTDSITTTFSGLFQDIEREAYTGLLLGPGSLEPVAGRMSNSTPIRPSSLIEYRYLANTTEVTLPFGTLTNIASYTQSGYDFTRDLSNLARIFTPGSGGVNTTDFGAKRYSDELRLAGSMGSFDWMIGGFYVEEKDGTDFDLQTTDANGVRVPATAPNFNVYHLKTRASFDEKAIFGNLTHHFTDRLQVTVGVRYSENSQDYTTDSIGLLLFNGGLPAHWGFPSEESSTSYLGTVVYKPQENMTLYARAASAYRPGGANVLTPVQIALGAPSTFSPDSLWNYELGAKGMIANNTLSYSVALYRMDWDKVQTNAVISGFSVIGNVAQASINGAEVSLSFRPLTNLTVMLNGAYNDAKFGADAPSIGAVNSAPLPNAPELSGSVDVEYKVRIVQGIDGSMGLTYSSVDEQLSQLVAGSRRKIPAYNSLDFRAGLDWATYSVTLRADNLTNEYGLTGIAAGPFGLEGKVIRPRTFGVSFQANF